MKLQMIACATRGKSEQYKLEYHRNYGPLSESNTETIIALICNLKSI